ncbi:MAG: AAA family ATPase [Chloroflexi bacterium RBG_16_48_7]|nr:MAG: AAA family ATPase [Chloroflexi bacterium RBG_16_48_7]
MYLKSIVIHPEKYPDTQNYPFALRIFQNTKDLSFDHPVTFFVGENGTGKSTLLKAICQKCHIYIWEEERIHYSSNPHENDFYKYLNVHWADSSVPGSFFGSHIFNDFARFLDNWARATPAILDYFGGSSLLTQSHGESFLSFFRAIYKVKGLHFLDEPETALSPASQIKLLKVFKEASPHAQFIIATHSPILLSYPNSTIYSFDSESVQPIKYEDTQYFRTYSDFFRNREKYIADLY